jgi:small subunit ribosomal protein S18
MTAKGRLRAKARKKARKAAKKKGSAFGRKKVCRFCADQGAKIEYRDPKGLRYFMTETGKLIPARISGNCARHQRSVSVAIKRARQLALMPYAPSHV